MRKEKKTALIIVDVQNDFCPGGALAVPKGDEVVPVINRLNRLPSSLPSSFDLVVLTRDWHPGNHCSFKEYGGIWPKHCVEYTKGADLHPDLKIWRVDWLLNVLKGFLPNKDAYSGFQGNVDLERNMKWNGIMNVYICGLATDYCVKATALDAQKLGFETSVIIDACRGVNVKKGDVGRAVREMRKAGIKIITSEEVKV